jgi:hypothetical protein
MVLKLLQKMIQRLTLGCILRIQHRKGNHAKTEGPKKEDFVGIIPDTKDRLRNYSQDWVNFPQHNTDTCLVTLQKWCSHCCIYVSSKESGLNDRDRVLYPLESTH